VLFSTLGSPWEVNVLDESARMSNKACVIGEGVRHFAASKIASFDIDICGAHKDQVKSMKDAINRFIATIIFLLEIGKRIDN